MHRAGAEQPFPRLLCDRPSSYSLSRNRIKHCKRQLFVSCYPSRVEASVKPPPGDSERAASLVRYPWFGESRVQRPEELTGRQEGCFGKLFGVLLHEHTWLGSVHPAAFRTKADVLSGLRNGRFS